MVGCLCLAIVKFVFMCLLGSPIVLLVSTVLGQGVALKVQASAKNEDQDWHSQHSSILQAEGLRGMDCPHLLLGPQIAIGEI